MPALIGNRRIATAALASKENVTYDTPDDLDESADFTKIGQGAYRVALLHKRTSVVYKVLRWGKRGGSLVDYENEAELRNARMLRNLAYPDRWWSTYVRIPLVSGFKIDDELVIAMEYIEGILGRDSNAPVNAYAELRSLGLDDMHGANYKVDNNGVFWPIDLASGCRPRPVHYYYDD